jgi:hypothetical protein
VGNFYVNFSVRSADPQQAADVLERAGRRAIVTPSRGGYVVVYDKEADRQATEPIMEVGCLLSRETGHPVFAVLNHDDDVLCYWLFEAGELSDSYNSNPDAFDEDEGAPAWRPGDAEKLCAVLRPGMGAAAVEAILRGDCGFAVDRHEQLADALGLPSWSVGFGYGYVARGDLEDELDASLLINVGGPPA